MKIKNIYVGDIKKIVNQNFRVVHEETGQLDIAVKKVKTVNEIEDKKNDAVMIEIKPGKYVDIDNINSVRDLLKLKLFLSSNIFDTKDIILSYLINPYPKVGDLFFVNKKDYSLKDEVSILKLKKLVKENRLNQVICSDIKY